MTSILKEINKVKSMLTIDEINSALELLSKFEKSIYVIKAKQEKAKISEYEQKLSNVDAKVGLKKGSIKIIGAYFPERGHIPAIPPLKHPYFINIFYNYYTVYSDKSILFDYKDAHLYPLIKFENNSKLKLNEGTRFFINNEEFVVVGNKTAIKITDIGVYNARDLYTLGDGPIKWWLYTFLKEIYSKKQSHRNKK